MALWRGVSGEAPTPQRPVTARAPPTHQHSGVSRLGAPRAEPGASPSMIIRRWCCTTEVDRRGRAARHRDQDPGRRHRAERGRCSRLRRAGDGRRDGDGQRERRGRIAAKSGDGLGCRISTTRSGQQARPVPADRGGATQHRRRCAGQGTPLAAEPAQQRCAASTPAALSGSESALVVAGSGAILMAAPLP
jgi:hypothetical protein